MRKAYLLLLFLISSSLVHAEPSAFGAGDLNSENPYGLTASEKVILKNKEALNSVERNSRDNQGKVDSLRERLDGLQAIIEGISQKSHENKMAIRQLTSEDETTKLSKAQKAKELETLIQANSENITQLKTVMTEFSTMIDTINSSYVSKDEFNALVTDVNAFKVLVAKELKSSAGSVNPYAGKSKGDIATLARKYYDKKLYTKAIAAYEYLISQKYKPARAHYMIGEMKYYRKEYKSAIAYFKKSAELYDKASYMPTLMLHTAVSMDKSGDKDNAQAFYKAITAKFPNTKIANEAKSRIK